MSWTENVLEEWKRVQGPLKGKMMDDAFSKLEEAMKYDKPLTYINNYILKLVKEAKEHHEQKTTAFNLVIQMMKEYKAEKDDFLKWQDDLDRILGALKKEYDEEREMSKEDKIYVHKRIMTASKEDQGKLKSMFLKLRDSRAIFETILKHAKTGFRKEISLVYTDEELRGVKELFGDALKLRKDQDILDIKWDTLALDLTIRHEVEVLSKFMDAVAIMKRRLQEKGKKYDIDKIKQFIEYKELLVKENNLIEAIETKVRAKREIVWKIDMHIRAILGGRSPFQQTGGIIWVPLMQIRMVDYDQGLKAGLSNIMEPALDRVPKNLKDDLLVYLKNLLEKKLAEPFPKDKADTFKFTIEKKENFILGNNQTLTRDSLRMFINRFCDEPLDKTSLKGWPRKYLLAYNQFLVKNIDMLAHFFRPGMDEKYERDDKYNLLAESYYYTPKEEVNKIVDEFKKMRERVGAHV